MTNNSSDARHYKRSTGRSKHENIKYQQRHFFGEQREDFQFYQINSNSGLSLIQEKVHQDLDVLKTQVTVFSSYFKDHLIPYLRLKGQSFRAGEVFLFFKKWM